jgi:hypothetical protein
MDLLSETIGRASARIGTVGWTLFITKIPVFMQDSLFRSGQLTSQVKLSLRDCETPQTGRHPVFPGVRYPAPL